MGADVREGSVEMTVNPVVKRIQGTFPDPRFTRFSRYARFLGQIRPGSWAIPKFGSGFMGFYRLCIFSIGSNAQRFAADYRRFLTAVPV